jgi:hypothetical protein
VISIRSSCSTQTSSNHYFHQYCHFHHIQSLPQQTYNNRIHNASYGIHREAVDRVDVYVHCARKPLGYLIKSFNLHRFRPWRLLGREARPNHSLLFHTDLPNFPVCHYGRFLQKADIQKGLRTLSMIESRVFDLALLPHAELEKRPSSLFECVIILFSIIQNSKDFSSCPIATARNQTPQKSSLRCNMSSTCGRTALHRRDFLLHCFPKLPR